VPLGLNPEHPFRILIGSLWNTGILSDRFTICSQLRTIMNETTGTMTTEIASLLITSSSTRVLLKKTARTLNTKVPYLSF